MPKYLILATIGSEMLQKELLNGVNDFIIDAENQEEAIKQFILTDKEDTTGWMLADMLENQDDSKERPMGETIDNLAEIFMKQKASKTELPQYRMFYERHMNELIPILLSVQNEGYFRIKELK